MRKRKPEELKDSDVKWISKTPYGWSEKKGKFLFNKIERPTREKDDIITVFRDGVVTLRKNRRTEGFTNSAKEIGYQGIRKGDLVIHEMDGFAGAIGISDSDGKSTPVYTVLNPRNYEEVESRYYSYLLRNMALTGYIESLAKGIRQRSTDFRYNDFGGEIYPVPKKPEQKAIATFLDRKTQAIDQLIEKKQQLIEKLKEKRQAFITQAVTKGLNPDVLMKDSGIEWLGEIPEHWSLIRLRYLSKIDTGNKDTQDSVDEGQYPFFVRSDTIEKLDSYSFDTEAVMTSGDGAGVCKIYHHFEGKFALHQRMYAIYDFNRVIGKYIYYSMKANFEKEVLKLSAKSTVESLRMPMLKNFPIVLCSEDEQKRIVKFIEDESTQIDNTVANITSQIEKLSEYRQSLISAAVTGKIDVRDEVEVEEIQA